jgi:hypothetical protein
MIYTVFKITEINRKAILLIQDKSLDKLLLSVFDEATENTLMRMVEPTVENLERAIKILKGEING